MNHSASGVAPSSSRPSGRKRDGTARMSPSPPMPRCLSHSAATWSGAMVWTPSGSAIRTKSLPVPCPFEKRRPPRVEMAGSRVSAGVASMFQGYRPCAGHQKPAGRGAQVPVQLQSVSACASSSGSFQSSQLIRGIGTEPGELPPGELPGGHDGLLGSLLNGGAAVEDPQELGVAQRPRGGLAVAQACRVQPADLLEQAFVHHGVDTLGEPFAQLFPVHGQADLDGRLEILPPGHEGAERPAGELVDFQCPDDPAGIRDPCRRHGVNGPQPRQERSGAFALRALLPARRARRGRFRGIPGHPALPGRTARTRRPGWPASRVRGCRR